MQNALDEGRLIIDPEPGPRRPAANSNEDCSFQTSSVDLRLADEISYFKEGLPLDINLSRGGFAQLFGLMSDSFKISKGQPFVLKPGRLVLGKTMEHVELPILEKGQCLAARVEGKSSYARCGLLVHFTAPTIHSGFAGTITLELINLGPCNISLYPGTPICQLIVKTVLGTPFRNDSQFQGQSRPGGHHP
ncbi:MAG: dCTP deaminase [Planctomycetaceae bacterium]|nr:dCTP deaminase [Planctomycetaceae bacterium]